MVNLHHQVPDAFPGHLVKGGTVGFERNGLDLSSTEISGTRLPAAVKSRSRQARGLADKRHLLSILDISVPSEYHTLPMDFTPKEVLSEETVDSCNPARIPEINSSLPQTSALSCLSSSLTSAKSNSYSVRKASTSASDSTMTNPVDETSTRPFSRSDTPPLLRHTPRRLTPRNELSTAVHVPCTLFSRPMTFGQWRTMPVPPVSHLLTTDLVRTFKSLSNGDCCASTEMVISSATDSASESLIPCRSLDSSVSSGTEMRTSLFHSAQSFPVMWMSPHAPKLRYDHHLPFARPNTFRCQAPRTGDDQMFKVQGADTSKRITFKCLLHFPLKFGGSDRGKQLGTNDQRYRLIKKSCLKNLATSYVSPPPVAFTPGKGAKVDKTEPTGLVFQHFRIDDKLPQEMNSKVSKQLRMKVDPQMLKNVLQPKHQKPCHITTASFGIKPCDKEPHPPRLLLLKHILCLTDDKITLKSVDISNAASLFLHDETHSPSAHLEPEDFGFLRKCELERQSADLYSLVIQDLFQSAEKAKQTKFMESKQKFENQSAHSVTTKEVLKTQKSKRVNLKKKNGLCLVDSSKVKAAPLAQLADFVIENTRNHGGVVKDKISLWLSVPNEASSTNKCATKDSLASLSLHKARYSSLPTDTKKDSVSKKEPHHSICKCSTDGQCTQKKNSIPTPPITLRQNTVMRQDSKLFRCIETLYIPVNAPKTHRSQLPTGKLQNVHADPLDKLMFRKRASHASEPMELKSATEQYKSVVDSNTLLQYHTLPERYRVEDYTPLCQRHKEMAEAVNSRQDFTSFPSQHTLKHEYVPTRTPAQDMTKWTRSRMHSLHRAKATYSSTDNSSSTSMTAVSLSSSTVKPKAGGQFYRYCPLQPLHLQLIHEPPRNMIPLPSFLKFNAGAQYVLSEASSSETLSTNDLNREKHKSSGIPHGRISHDDSADGSFISALPHKPRSSTKLPPPGSHLHGLQKQLKVLRQECRLPPFQGQLAAVTQINGQDPDEAETQSLTTLMEVCREGSDPKLFSYKERKKKRRGRRRRATDLLYFDSLETVNFSDDRSQSSDKIPLHLDVPELFSPARPQQRPPLLPPRGSLFRPFRSSLTSIFDEPAIARAPFWTSSGYSPLPSRSASLKQNRPSCKPLSLQPCTSMEIDLCIPEKDEFSPPASLQAANLPSTSAQTAYFPNGPFLPSCNVKGMAGSLSMPALERSQESKWLFRPPLFLNASRMKSTTSVASTEPFGSKSQKSCVPMDISDTQSEVQPSQTAMSIDSIHSTHSSFMDVTFPDAESDEAMDTS